MKDESLKLDGGFLCSTEASAACDRVPRRLFHPSSFILHPSPSWRGSLQSSTRSRASGFTLVEVLAAMLFMAIVLPVIVEGMAIASRAGVVAQRSREAAQLADLVLTEMVVTREWQQGDQEGDFDPDHPGFHWSLVTDAWTEDAMRVLTVEVRFSVQGRESSVTLSTLVPEAETAS